MDDKIKKIISLIQKAELDQTIKDILIRDLQTYGLTDELRQQIEAYCLEGIRIATAKIEEAKKALGKSSTA